ncbi:MAG: tetratricopeptide repeat protein, partial [Nitrospinota bacterium]
AAYRKAVQFAPGFPMAYYHLGKAFLDLRAWDKAIESLTIATKLDPGMADAHRALAFANQKGLLENSQRGVQKEEKQPKR